MPLRVVIDTNVLVAAAKSRRGSSFALLGTLRSGKWQMIVSTALLAEYDEQLKREALRQNRPLPLVDRFLDQIARISDRRETYFLLRPLLRDPKDDFILELAVAARADYIVTWNARDFLRAKEYGVGVIRPDEFLKSL